MIRAHGFQNNVTGFWDGKKNLALKNCVVFRNVALAHYAIVHLFASTDDVAQMKVPGCVEIGIE